MIPIGGRTEELGALLRIPCSRCETARWFRLMRHSASVRLLGLALARSSACSLHCEACGYTMDLSEDDAERAMEFLPVAGRFRQGQMEEREFLDALGNAGFAFLEQFAAANTHWQCDQCGEASPFTFDACWNCGWKRGEGASPLSGDSVKTPYLDHVVEEGSGTFGGMRL